MHKDLLETAILLAEEYGYMKITRDQIALQSGASTGTVSNKLGSMSQMRKKLVSHAVRTKNHRIIAQAIAMQDPYVMRRMTFDERVESLRAVA